MGGTEPWMETDREYMEREYRMRSIESIVGDDGICAEEIDGIVTMADRLVNYVMTGDHHLPASADKQPEPGYSLKDLTEPRRDTFMGESVSRVSVPVTVEEDPPKKGMSSIDALKRPRTAEQGPAGGHEPGPKCGPEC